MFWKQTRTRVGFVLYVEEFATAVVADVQKDGHLLVLSTSRFQDTVFKSVAHYLIQTRQSQRKQEEPAAGKPHAANMLSSSDTEDLKSDIGPNEIPKYRSEDDNDVKEFGDDKYNKESQNHGP
ncbi:zinc-finger domain of monoamine-oxidase A repressor R1 [Actinidia rufa]|uniref:Zinc-finger domain of monoamine-oxidase A repressor R1 n=1 Tax=Actinidia rufa TaxID=165716 RepID=A0A7J0DRR0_9ERIC|nr:zinc-finger domain of monoamine-oxidase A repressor R1 [Actinidia rufa]